MKNLVLSFLVIFLLTDHFVVAQKRKSNKNSVKTSAATAMDTSLFKGLKWRNIGPFRGGRSVAVTGVPGNDQVYFMGSTGGGVWKTEDAGTSWKNMSDGFFKTGSVGDIKISASDPNVIYVGMGEHAVRGVMTSYGDGVYKSEDAGKTWKHMGLELTRHISDVVIHPTNPDVVYVAAQGTPHGPSADRGIYKSIDGGKNWKKVLFVNESTGASGLSMDPNNPRIMFAAFWDHIRFPWQVKSGGEGSGIYKSTDGGETWNKLSKGLPEMMGKIGVSVSGANSNRVYAVIEAEKGGVYRSDDGGSSWKQVCADRITITRSWYYMEIFADPKDEETVYVLNAPALRSIDGGKTFTPMPVGHGDTHDLWINPENTNNFILGDDGGAEITFNTGKTWSRQDTQPTAQFYRVNTDNQFPYKVYGGQQDNSSVIIDSRSFYGSIGWKNWTYGPGCESAYLAFDPNHPEIVLGGCYQGIIERLDTRTLTQMTVMEYSNIGLGTTPTDLKYRFNWNAPIVASPQNPQEIYHGGNVVFKTSDYGMTWKEISPDLTRNDKSKQVQGGAPFTNEGAGGENYNTILYMALSPHKKGTIWVGSDDGLLNMTENDGETWAKINIPGLQETMINSIEVSPHDDNTVYVVSTRYKLNDYSPMVHKTTDKGKTWTKIIDGIGKYDFIRVVREDKKVKGLLYAGAETGLYVSVNGGGNWTKVQLNLPVVPINDLIIQDNDLVAATAGRAFWILDDLSAFQQSKGMFSENIKLYTPKPNYRVSFGGRPRSSEGQNPSIMAFDYYLPLDKDSSELILEIYNQAGDLIRTYSSEKDPNAKPFPGGPQPEPVLGKNKGINRFVWDMRVETLPAVPGVFIMGNYSGYMVSPGKYTAKLKREDYVSEAVFELLPDPRLDYAQSQYLELETFLKTIQEQIVDIHVSVTKIRSVKDQVNAYAKWYKEETKADTLISLGKTILEKVEKWENTLIQPKQKTFQDVINFPNQLSAEL
ncbi:MAG: glycosyl hydrolase, partial [Cyclobacteriaceae bacterium]|nr:glycosyl hydrolase [Cyclobacteriaceae bacterium]